MKSLRCLHLSDLHFGQPEAASRRGFAEESFLNDLRVKTKELGPPELAFLTGDLTFSGLAEQYAEVDAALARMRRVFAEQVPEHRCLFIPVPGNHDLMRPNGNVGCMADLRGYHDDARLRAQVLDGNAPLGRSIRACFAGYERWLHTSIAPTWKVADAVVQVQHGSMPGDIALSIRHRDVRIGIIGLNSSFLHLNDRAAEGSLAVEPEQLPVVLPDFLQAHDVTFLLMHHPPNWLQEQPSRIL